LKSWDGVRGDLVAIGFGYGDGGACGGEGFGQMVAGFGSADEEERFAWRLWKERFRQRFRDVAGGDEIDGQADCVGGREGGGTDDGNLFGKLGEMEELGAAVEGVDGVGAGEEKPIVGAKASEGGIEGAEAGWGNDLYGGDKDGCSAESFKLNGELGGLVTGSGDEDAFVRESEHYEDFSPGGLAEVFSSSGDYLCSKTINKGEIGGPERSRRKDAAQKSVAQI
jgi:hypothetical protein